MINTMILSKFNHLFMSIVTPKQILDDLNRMLFSYLWGGKTHKIKRLNVCADYLKGGLRMVDIYEFEKSLKLGWMKLPWNLLLQESCKNIFKMFYVGPEWFQQQLPNLNRFWCNVFEK